MKPVSPVMKGFEDLEVIYAKDQPEYLPLPVIRLIDGHLITRWRLTFKERLRVLLHGDLYLQVHTFSKPLQPLKLSVEPPEMERT